MQYAGIYDDNSICKLFTAHDGARTVQKMRETRNNISDALRSGCVETPTEKILQTAELKEFVTKPPAGHGASHALRRVFTQSIET